MATNPLLFMKVGAIGSAPNGFYPELAHTFGAVTHDTAQSAKDLNLANAYSPMRALKIRKETQARAIASLAAGHNTFYDGYLNRAEFRRELAAEALAVQPDARIVILALKDTTRNLRKARIVEKYDCGDAETLPPRAKRDLERSDDMINNMQWPSSRENPLNLDGRQNTGVLLCNIFEHIHEISRAKQ